VGTGIARVAVTPRKSIVGYRDIKLACNYIPAPVVKRDRVFCRQKQLVLHTRIQTTLDLYTQKDSDEARAAGRVPASAWDAIGAGAMKMWAGLWVQVFRLLDAKPLKMIVPQEPEPPETRTPSILAQVAPANTAPD
jgi:hypothetical protein